MAHPLPLSRCVHHHTAGQGPSRRRCRLHRASHGQTVAADPARAADFPRGPERRSGLLECAWPGQAFLDRTIEVGQTLLVSGTVRFYHGRQLAPREFVILADQDSDGDEPLGGRVLPVYPATEGLSHKTIRGLVNRHLEELVSLAPDVLPETLRGDGLPSLPEALEAVHRPDSLEDAERGRRRLAFDELLDLQLMLARARLIAKRGRSGVAFQIRHDLTRGLAQSLPWKLTADQKRAIREITADMTSPERMHRILMGDVGTGKTVVALFAMLLALENGYQAALMAPTELLAEQHGATLTELLAPLRIRPELLLGRLSNAEKADRRSRLSNGSLRLVVGTHALVQESVSFQRLGLVVIDEQHRFGVEQRAALVAKARHPMYCYSPRPRSLVRSPSPGLEISIFPPSRPVRRAAARSRPAYAPRNSGTRRSPLCASNVSRDARPTSCCRSSRKRSGPT